MKKKRKLRTFIAAVLSILILSAFATTAAPESPKELDPEAQETIQMQYLHEIQTYFQNLNNPNSNLTESAITAVNLSYQNLNNYEQAIPKLVQSHKVSENVAFHNLNRLKKMLAGEHTNFYSYTPHVAPINLDTQNSCIGYRITLNNGNRDSQRYYYSINIWITN